METAKKIVAILRKAENITKWTQLVTETASFLVEKIETLFNLNNIKE